MYLWRSNMETTMQGVSLFVLQEKRYATISGEKVRILVGYKFFVENFGFFSFSARIKCLATGLTNTVPDRFLFYRNTYFI